MRYQAVLAILIGFYVSTLYGKIPYDLSACGEPCGFHNSGVCLKDDEAYGLKRIPGDCEDPCSCFKKLTIGCGGRCGWNDEGICQRNDIIVAFSDIVPGGNCPPFCHCVKDPTMKGK